MNIKFTIVIPTLFQRESLNRLISSINCLEDLSDVEVIFVTREHTPRVVSFITPRCEYRIIYDARKGIYRAMNTGIKAAKGEYIFFIGDDDAVVSGINCVFEFARNYIFDVLAFDVIYETTGLRRQHTNRWRLLLRNICHQGVLFRTETLKRFGPYPQAFKSQADHYINIKLLASKEVRAKHLSVIGSIYSDGGFSTQIPDNAFRQNMVLIFSKYYGRHVAVALCVKRWLYRLLFPSKKRSKT